MRKSGWEKAHLSKSIYSTNEEEYCTHGQTYDHEAKPPLDVGVVSPRDGSHSIQGVLRGPGVLALWLGVFVVDQGGMLVLDGLIVPDSIDEIDSEGAVNPDGNYGGDDDHDHESR